MSSQGAKTSLSSLSAKPHPLLLPPLWRQRLPLGEGSCLEISWILLTAQSRRRKQPRRLRSEGGVLTRRPSAGPEPRSVCRSTGECGWGRGTWQPPGLVAICSCSISLMSLFRIPRALTPHWAEGWGTKDPEKEQGQPPPSRGNLRKQRSLEGALLLKGMGLFSSLGSNSFSFRLSCLESLTSPSRLAPSLQTALPDPRWAPLPSTHLGPFSRGVLTKDTMGQDSKLTPSFYWASQPTHLSEPI